MDYIYLLATAIIAFIIGSIPFAIIVGKSLYNVDVRDHGSGNPGATNALRVIGPVGGLIVFLADVIKGVLAVILGTQIAANLTNYDKFPLGIDGIYLFMVVAGLFVILGHSFSLFLNFKGGKGIATALGTIVVIYYANFNVLLAMFLVWMIAMFITRYVSVASISATYVLPYLSFFMFPSRPELLFFSSALFLIVVYTHRENIKRLLKGTENRFSSKKPSSEPETFESIRNL